jgi:hypothetical protein
MPVQKSDRILQCLAAVRKEFRMFRELFITNTSIVRAGPFARGLPDGHEETVVTNCEGPGSRGLTLGAVLT